MTYKIENGKQNRLTVEDKIKIVHYYKKYGTLNIDDARFLNSRMEVDADPRYITCVKDLVWFKEYCQIYDMLSRKLEASG